jgi:chaperone required for assembly of F1-ATPase
MAIARESLRIQKEGEGFIPLIDGKALRSPLGNTLALPTRRLARAMIAELATHENIDASRLNLYCLASTQADFIQKGKGIQPEHVARIVLLDPALQVLPETDLDVLSPAQEILSDFLESRDLYHPQIPVLTEPEIEKWLMESSEKVKRNIEGILVTAREIFISMDAAEHTVLINAGKVHRSFMLGLMLAKKEVSPTEYAAAIMATLRISPLAWKNIGTDQYRAAYEEVRLQADSMRLYIEECSTGER